MTEKRAKGKAWSLIDSELSTAVAAEVMEFAADIAAKFGDSALGVVFYGSCLREEQLAGMMLDFYVIVDDYARAYGHADQPKWMARGNKWLPPNVFPAAFTTAAKDTKNGAETGEELAAKYAVLDLADLRDMCAVNAGDVSVWARFCQPIRLVWQRDAAAANDIGHALAQSPQTFFTLAAPMALDAKRAGQPLNEDEIMAVWRTGFTLTYGAELRSERGDRPDKIVDFAPDYYRQLGAAMVADSPGITAILSIEQAENRWQKLRKTGKKRTLLRLAKASLTFAGGIDYLAWKINRHAGTQIEITPWMRKWPIAAAIRLLPRLIRSGAIK